MAKNYYEALGLKQNATQDEIKSAYKRLAKQHHPDVNQGKPEAEAKFKEINEAYRVLGDAEKRARFDRTGQDEQRQAQGGPGGAHSGFSGGFEGGFGVDLGDIFGEFFGGRGRSRRGADIELLTRISLSDVAKGKRIQVSLDREAPCTKCDGTGAQGGKRRECGTCKGRGQVRRTQRTPFGVMQVAVACDDCNGAGSIPDKPCTACKGAGKSLQEETVPIDIPAGIHDRMQLRVPGRGHAGGPGQESGDLLIGVLVDDHELFTREGDDLHVASTISYPQAALGTTIDVPTLTDTTVTIAVPAGTQPGTVLRAKGKGLPHLRGGSGDLLVTITLRVPKTLSKKERELLESLAGIEKPKSFFERFKL